jgi:hypothetical protein
MVIASAPRGVAIIILSAVIVTRGMLSLWCSPRDGQNMAQPDLGSALYHARKSLTTAAGAFVLGGLAFFFVGTGAAVSLPSRFGQPAVWLLVAPLVGAVLTLLLGRVRWRMSRPSRGLILNLPGVLAFAPFPFDYSVGQRFTAGSYWVQLIFGLFWLVLYVNAVRAVNDICDKLIRH